MVLPKPSGEFEWVQESWGSVLRCGPLLEVARHCFTSTELCLQDVRDRDGDGWHRLARTLGVSPDEVIRLRQVHGTGVFEAEEELASGAPFDAWPEADIAITANPSLALSVRAADCVPILLADRRSAAVAAVHAGWRGTASGSASVAVRALAARYGTDAADVIAAVGPSAGPCCYQVGRELIPRFEAHADAAGWFSRESPAREGGAAPATEEKPRLDLWQATRDQLARAGVPDKQIHVCELCTVEHPSVLPSYRRDGERAGRLVAAIRSGPDRMP
jgi:YfiH family protein